MRLPKQFPIVLRKTMNEKINKKNMEIKRIEEENLQTINRLSKELDDVLPKLFKITICESLEYDRYRIAIDFETHWIDECFIHGNSQSMIEHLSNRLAKQIEYELKSTNFARFKQIISEN